MNQHPIPQNISTYKFRLIGDMTVKQFILLALGIGGAVLFYTSNLLGLIKYTLIGISALIGIGMAFFTIDGRPMETWIKAYLTAIYAPTQFIWRKTPKIPAFFSYTPSPDTIPAQTQEMLSAAVRRKQAGLSSFLQTLPEYQLSSKLNQQEASHLSQITNLFTHPQPITHSAIITPPPLPSSNLIASQVHINTLPTQTPVAPPQSHVATTPNQSSNLRDSIQPSGVIVAPEIKIINETKASPVQPLTGTIQISSAPPQPSTPQPQAQTTNQKPLPSARTTQKPVTDQKLPFPSTPTTPNTAVGMVLDKDDKIIENAIIEIRDPNGTPVRATKTNKLGQFISTTPLKNGTYQLQVDKDGYEFDLVSLELKGQILPPLKIQAK
jgi:hypothetical protein